MPGRLEIHLFGSFDARLDGLPITDFESNKVRALLAYLTAEASQEHRRQKLAALFWPDWPEATARTNLRNALSKLRKSLQEEGAQSPYLLICRETIQWNLKSDAWVDVLEFIRLAEGINSSPSDLEKAAQIQQRPFLEGFSIDGSPEFEEWYLLTCQGLQRQLMDILSRLALLDERRGELSKAIARVRRQLALEPLEESLHQQLIRLLGLNGERKAALAQFEEFRQTMRQELGVEPSAETTQLVESIRGGKLEPIRPSHLPPNNLPAPLTRFFGRQAEIALVKESLAAGRLVTLTGAGGVGKTRLSLRAAGEILNDFPNGVWFIELAALIDPKLVPQQILLTLGFHEDADNPALEILEYALRRQVILLVMDNCEHLLEKIAPLAEGLLHSCPGLKILATSRQPLGVMGEIIVRVPPLPFPSDGEVVILEKLDAYPAIALLVDRARQALPGYQVTDSNAASLALICQRLDGIPLAIELAAVQMGTLTAAEVASRLDSAFHLLVSGNLGALPRQQTLQATIDWSYNLLEDEERRLFRRLAVFAGEWDLDGAEGVCAGAGLDKTGILDRLGSLVNKSMVAALRFQGRLTRYRFLETIRQYAYQKLAEAGEIEAVQKDHLAYYLTLAEKAETGLHGPEQADWLHRSMAELENFRLALTIGLETDPRTGMRLASALWYFWERTGRNTEGESWLENYLSRPENATQDAWRAQALYRLVLLDGKNPDCEKWLRESLEIYLKLNDILEEANVHYAWGVSWMLRNENYISAKIHGEAAAEIYEELDDTGRLASALGFLSLLAMFSGDMATQISSREKSLALYRQINQPHDISIALQFLSDAVMMTGDLTRAKLLVEEAAEIDRRIEPAGFRDDLWYSYADILCWQGDYSKVKLLMEDFRNRAYRPDEAGPAHVSLLVMGRFYSLLGLMEQGIALIEQGLEFFREPGIHHRALNLQQTFMLELAYALGSLGKVGRARRLVDEFMPIFQAPYYQPTLAIVQGMIHLRSGESQQAAQFYQEGLRHAHRMGRKLQVLQALEGYAWSLEEEQQPDLAARFLGAAAEFRTRIGAREYPRDLKMYDQVIAKLKVNLGEAVYAEAWAQGQRDGFEQVVKEVLGAGTDSPQDAQDLI